MDGMSLLDVLRGVMLDPAEQAAYNADPNAYLEQYGYDDVDPADLSEAFGLVADTLPADQAQAALSATPPPSDDATFGSDTADFDVEPTLGDAGVAAADAEVDLDLPGPASLDPGDEVGSEPALSFGGGAAEAADVDAGDAGVLDDPTFDEGDDALPGTDTDTDGLGGVDNGLDVDSGLDVDFGADSIDEVDDQYGGGDDDLDDGLDDGLDELDDPGPDDLDIGSF